MKKTSLGIIFALCIAGLFFSGCKKYPDGPTFSFRSRSTRLSGTWYIDHYFINGTDQTSTQVAFWGADYVLNIVSDGTYQIYGNFPDNGTCSFEDKQSEFYLQSYSTGTLKENYTILKLEFKSLWVKHTNSKGDLEEIHYIAYR